MKIQVIFEPFDDNLKEKRLNPKNGLSLFIDFRNVLF